jgi:DNA-binding response OmpR family regulator
MANDHSAADGHRTADGLTVMVVEPDVVVRMAIAEFLRECGYKVIETGLAEDVLTVLQSGAGLDIVFTEVKLPGAIDGFTLARDLRQTHPEIDVILASGIQSAAEKSEDLCDDGPIQKPYHPQTVVGRINLLLERRRSSKTRI